MLLSRILSLSTRRLTPIGRESLLLLALVLQGQLAAGNQADTGAIRGKVQQPSGAVVAGATVTLTSENNSLPVRTVSSAADGSYSFEAVREGTYSLSAESSGFQKVTRNRIELKAGEQTVVDFVLEAGAQSPQLGPASYYESNRLKSGAPADTTDPGGYSASGQAQATRRLVQGAARLKQGAPATNSNPSQAESAALAKIEAELRSAVKARPEDFETNHRIGEFYIHAGKLADAIPYLEKAFGLNPAHYVNDYDLALAYLETQRLEQARKQILQLLERQDNAELHNLLAEVEERSGNFINAENEYERAAHMDPSESNIFDWGTELLVHRALEAAIEIFKEGTKRYPRSARMQIGLGVALYSRGLYDDAVKTFCLASDLDPSDPRSYFFLGKTSSVSPSQGEEITRRLRRFLELHAENALAHYYYAMSLWKGKRAEDLRVSLGEIESLLKRAAELDPKLSDAYLQLGIVYADQKKYAQAIREFQSALNAQPDLTEAHYRLGQAYLRTGEKARAQEEFEVYNRLHKEQQEEAEKQRAEMRQFILTMK